MNDAHAQPAAERQERAPMRHLVFGLMLIVGGILLTLNGHGIEYVFGLWPLVPVGLGVDRILNACCTHRRRAGTWLLAIGSWLSLNAFTTLGYRDTWPLLLLAVGVLIMWEAVSPSGDRCPSCAEGADAR